MKRLTILAILFLGMAVLTACAPGEVDSTVNNFFEQWKASDTAEMAKLMTAEAYFGMFMPETPSDDPKGDPGKRIPASTLAEFLVTEFEFEQDTTLSIMKTDVHNGYAIVQSSVIWDSTDPSYTEPYTFHLKKTGEGWKIYLIYIVSLF